ncbi:MAG: putative spermidine/putrescine transport system permease protein [Saliniramus fredricksonii]|uniref:Spermidine/putrescine transport system permease protein n=1 Tax=Saliniramus fredricksonii TaxID=1653334 RepID=A0A0P7Y5C6_9HYPH|nr:ABC transporter permease [Saliniramus fredricksonii]KPQ12235.1 MAG: putative spermidine/putrescine transport system permease protein [Saliniramus fredricksonii]SCC78921.1 putative spermidine/putrescine transport system permease protein [Saliniramus fredricksonii]
MAQADAGNADLMQDASGQMVTADGVPLKLSLKRAERQRKLMALALVLPLLLFLLVVFIFPIGQMMWRSVDNPQVVNALPQTLEALQGWDGEELPGEEVYAALAADFRRDMERPRRDQFSGPLGVRLNYELSAARGAVARTVRKVPDFEPPYKEAFLDSHRLWGDVALWRVIEREGRPLTSAYYVAALDRQFNDEGEIELRDENRRIYTDLYIRTLGLSITITVLTILLGFPIAYYMSILPMRYSNLLMIFVLLPFWTSLLVRTTAWIVLLQQQGVINESLIAVGIIGEDGRFSLMYNMFGTIIAMTHILLPFMVLPLYSVMRTIPPSYMRAAKSLGATPFTAFRKVYLPQTLPGIGAGAVLVFIISIGYYITPALVGGQSGRMISNEIARHMQQSLNWGLAAALGTILLLGVLVLYWAYNRLVGADNLKLG